MSKTTKQLVVAGDGYRISTEKFDQKEDKDFYLELGHGTFEVYCTTVDERIVVAEIPHAMMQDIVAKMAVEFGLPDAHEWVSRAQALWNLLDDLDTLDDIARDDDELYRVGARELARRRSKVAICDGAGKMRWDVGDDDVRYVKKMRRVLEEMRSKYAGDKGTVTAIDGFERFFEQVYGQGYSRGFCTRISRSRKRSTEG